MQKATLQQRPLKSSLAKICYGILLLSLTWQLTAQESLLPAHLYKERLENPGLSIQTAREIAENPSIFPLSQDQGYLEAIVKSLYFLELNQDYPRSLAILEYLDSLVLSESDKILEPYFGPRTFGLMSMRIPEYYVSLGDFTKARQWLGTRIPGLTDTREIHYAALVLSRILTLEGRFDQAQRLLETRFLQPLREGSLPPFGEKALVTAVDLFLESNQIALARDLSALAQERYPGTFETLLIENTLNTAEKGTPPDQGVRTLPVPGTLLAGSEAFSLGLVTLSPLPSADPPTTEEPSTEGPGSSEPDSTPGYIQIGSFSSSANAERFESLAKDRGFEVLRRSDPSGGPIRLLVPVDERGATTLQLVLRESGIEGFYVTD